MPQFHYAASGIIRAADCTGKNDYICVESKDVKGAETKLPIDSGAHINLIKSKVLKENMRWDSRRAVTIKSIVNEEVRTEGPVSVCLSNGVGSNWVTQFQAVNESIDLPFDGLLGLEFLDENKVVLDYGRRRMQIRGVWMELREECEEATAIRASYAAVTKGDKTPAKVAARTETVAAKPQHKRKIGAQLALIADVLVKTNTRQGALAGRRLRHPKEVVRNKRKMKLRKESVRHNKRSIHVRT